MKNNNEKNEKKGGVFGLLNGSAANAGGITPGVLGGTAQAASSATGLAALLGGKALGTLITVIAVAGIGTFGLMGGSGMGSMGNGNSEEMLARAQEAENYVPALQRAEAENAGKSSIGMFNETNRGAVKFDVDPTANAKYKDSGAAGEASASEMGEYDTDSDASVMEGVENEMSEAMGDAAAALNNGNFSTSIGGGSDRSSKSLNMGGSSTPKLKPTFSPIAKNLNPASKSGKSFAFRKPRAAQKRAATKAGARGGRRAMDQANFMNGMMRQAAASSNYATSRATMDAAWEGTTTDGDVGETLDAGSLTEGEGMSYGTVGTGLGGAGGAYIHNPGTSDYNWVPDAIIENPWQAKLDAIHYLFMGAMTLVMLGAAAAEIKPWGYIAAAVMAGLAAIACAVAIGLAISIMTEYGQNKLGGMWIAICGVGMLACIAALWTGVVAAKAAAAKTTCSAMAACKAICLLVGGLGTIGSSLAGSFDSKTIDDGKLQEHCKKDPESCGIKNNDNNSAVLPYELSDTPITRNLLS